MWQIKQTHKLINPWGIALLPGNPFWVANNRSGTSTLYDAQGNKQQLAVTIPSASVNPCSPGCPTGIVANSSADFNGGAFIFDTDDGIIANWTGANSAVVAFDNSQSGADYKGLALLNNGSANFLLAANWSWIRKQDARAATRNPERESRLPARLDQRCLAQCMVRMEHKMEHKEGSVPDSDVSAAESQLAAETMVPKLDQHWLRFFHGDDTMKAREVLVIASFGTRAGRSGTTFDRYCPR